MATKKKTTVVETKTIEPEVQEVQVKSGSRSVESPQDTSQEQKKGLDLRNNSLSREIASKQPILVSGTNIKTINGQSVLGSGNLEVDRHFKGWWPTAEELIGEGNAEPGDYAYIPDASPATTASIYAYDSTASSTGYWADTGKKADTSNVQTFASGEEVNEVHIVNDLTTGGSEDVLSAEQGKVLNKDINGLEPVEIDPSSVLTSPYTYIVNTNEWLVNNANQQGVYFPAYPGRKMTIKANSTYQTIFAIVKNIGVASYDPVTFATGESRRSISAGESLEITTPQDAVYVWFATKSYSNNPTPESIHVEGYVGIEQRLSVVEDKLQHVSLTKLKFENGGIGDDGKMLSSQKESNFFRCFRTPNYIKATKIHYTPSGDETVSVYTYNNKKQFVAKQVITGDYLPTTNIAFVKVQVMFEDADDNKTNMTISQGGLDNNGDEEVSTNWVRTGFIDIEDPQFDSVWFVGKLKYRIYDTNQTILVSGTSYARGHNLYGGVMKFRDFLDLLSGQTFYSIKDTAKYLRIAFATNPESNITPSSYDVRFTLGDLPYLSLPSIFVENYDEEFNEYQSDSTISFAYKFNAGGNGKQVSAAETATAPALYDTNSFMSSGVLILPSSYSEKGKPTPLIIYVHASGDYGYLGMNVLSQYYMDYLGYWQKEGFAVVDFFARTTKYGAVGGDINGMPTNLASYEQGYKWLIEHYNIDRSGCFVSAKSMGGVGALMICYSKSIPVKAADLLAPVLNPFYQQCGYGIESRKDYIYDLRLDNADDLVEDPSPASPMSQNDFNALMIANRDKLVGYNAYFSKVPNKTWAELVELKFKNPGTFDDVVKFCDVPFRIHIAEDDTTVAYNQSLNLIKALKNSGSIAEIRTMPANTGQHHAVDNSPDALKVASITTELGYICTDVPLAYVEVANWFKFYR